MEQKKIEQLYKDCKANIKNAVNKVQKYYPGDEDIPEEANLIFMECIRTFSGEPSKFQNYLNRTLSKQLRRRIFYNTGGIRRKKINGKEEYQSIILEDISELPLAHKETKNVLKLAEESLSKDSFNIIKAVIEPSLELLKMNGKIYCRSINNIHILQKDLFEYFRKQGWKRSRILNSFQEIKSMLREGI